MVSKALNNLLKKMINDNTNEGHAPMIDPSDSDNLKDNSNFDTHYSEQLEDVDEKERIFRRYGLGETYAKKFLTFINNSSFCEDSQINAEYLWNKSLWRMKNKGKGLYSVLEAQDHKYKLSDFLFILNRHDLELICLGRGRRLDHGNEEIEILQKIYDQYIRKNKKETFISSRGLQVAFTDQKALWGTNSILGRGEYYIACGCNFFIPAHDAKKIAQITVRGKVKENAVGGFQNIFGKTEKKLYHSEGSKFGEETYPIYSSDVDFTIDGCLFDNITILDIPSDRRIQIYQAEDSQLPPQKKWKIDTLASSNSKKEERRRVWVLDEEENWILVKQEDESGGFVFDIYKGGKDDEHRVLQGTFQLLERSELSSQDAKKTEEYEPLKAGDGPTEQSEQVPAYEESHPKQKISPQVPAYAISQPKQKISPEPPPEPARIEEFVLTHRLVPCLPEFDEASQEKHVISLGPPSDYIERDSHNSWLQIMLGRDLELIPQRKLYLLGEETPFEIKKFTIADLFDRELKDLTIVDKPNISDPSEASFHCHMDFTGVPKDIDNQRSDWCFINIKPNKPYPITQNGALIGWGCYQPRLLDLIPDGFLDSLFEECYRSIKKGEDTTEINRCIYNYSYMTFGASRYHGFFLKEDETLTNISLNCPIYVYGLDGKQKLTIPHKSIEDLQEMIKEDHLEHLMPKIEAFKAGYQKMTELQRNIRNRDKLKKHLEKFLSECRTFIITEELYEKREKTKLESGDSVVIGLSRFLYLKRPTDQTQEECLEELRRNNDETINND